MGNDDRLMARLAVTTAIVMLIAAGGLAAHFDWVVAGNLLLGCVLGLGSLALLHRTVMAMGSKVAAGEKGKLTGVALLQVGKFLVLAVAVGALFATGKANAPALAAGVTLPTLVLCAMEAGRRVGRAVRVGGGPAPAGDGTAAPPDDVDGESD